MKLRVRVVQQGDSLYTLIPAKVAKYFDLKKDDEALITFEKYISEFQQTCILAKNLNQEITATFGNHQITGKVIEVNEDTFCLFDQIENKSHYIPFSILLKMDSLGGQATASLSN